jgi:HEPN domain-containing protein
MADQLKVEADAWLRRARDDLGAARKLLAGHDTFPATASYHCQQAAEKALKAVLVADTVPIPKTHDLRVLIERCLLLEPSLDALRDACDELTPFATEFRYPTDAPDPTREDVAYAVTLSALIVDAAELALKRRFP